MFPSIDLDKTEDRWAPLHMSSEMEKDLPRTYTVLNCIFEYLPLEDIKNCRHVCSKWNFVAKSYITKLATIHFKIGSLTPKQLIEEFSHLNFSVFTFSSLPGGNSVYTDMSPWFLSDIMEFCTGDCGKNIKSLKLINLTLKTDKSKTISNFDLTPLLEPLTNLTELTIEPEFEYDRFDMTVSNKTQTKFNVLFDKLSSLKSVKLKNCYASLPDYLFVRMVPIKISLIEVVFLKPGNSSQGVVVINDLVDLSEAKEITVIKTCTRYNPIFNLTNEIVNVEKLTLKGCKFIKKTEIPIKQIIFDDAIINLSILPETIEKIHFKSAVNFKYDPYDLQPNTLPNLRFVAIEQITNKNDRDNVKYGVSSFQTYCRHLKCRSLNAIWLESDIRMSHKGPILEDKHRKQFPQQDRTTILFAPSATLPYKLDANFDESLKQGTFSLI